MNKTISLVSILLVCVFLNSCKKEIIVTEYQTIAVDPNTWKPASEIDYWSKNIVNGAGNNQRAIFSSPTAMIIKRPGDITAASSATELDRQVDVTPNVQLTYRKHGTREDLVLQSPNDWNGYNLSHIIDTIPGLSFLGGNSRYNKWTAIRSDEKQFVFEFASPGQTLNYALVDFTTQSNSRLWVTDVTIASITKEDFYSHITIKSFFNKYYICQGEKLEVLNGQGIFEQTSGLPNDLRFYDVVLKADSLIAFGDQAIYYSTDQGYNWQMIYENIDKGLFNVRYYDYTVIRDEIVMIKNDELHHLMLEPMLPEVHPILSDALIHNKITSVFNYRDTIYATTLSGTFRKPLTEFFTYEEE